MIVKRGKRYVLKSKESGRTRGVHPSREAAERQETAINMSKARAAGHKLPPPPDERGETMRRIRSGKAKFAVPFLLALGLAHGARAATLTCPAGYLTAPGGQTTTGPSANTVVARSAPALVFQLQGAGTSTSAQVEICCSPFTCGAAAVWAPVQGGSVTLSGGNLNAAVSVLDPTCMYRVMVTACTSCSLNVAYACSGAH